MNKPQFDVILMNPPYQRNSKDGIGRNKLLWPLFVNKAIELCKDGGYIANIHPSIWRKPWSKIYPILAAYDMKFLMMRSRNFARKTFKAATRFDVYVMHKTANQGKTIVIDENDVETEINLQEIPFLPSANINGVFSLIDKTGHDRVNVLFCTYYHTKYKKLVKDKKSDTHKYPLLHTVTAKGPMFKYTSTTERGLFGVKNKVILNIGEYIYPILDLEGEYGMTEGCFAIVCDSKEEAENVWKAVGSEKFRQEIVKSTKWSNFKVEYAMFSYFKKDFWKSFV